MKRKPFARQVPRAALPYSHRPRRGPDDAHIRVRRSVGSFQVATRGKNAEGAAKKRTRRISAAGLTLHQKFLNNVWAILLARAF